MFGGVSFFEPPHPGPQALPGDCKTSVSAAQRPSPLHAHVVPWAAGWWPAPWLAAPERQTRAGFFSLFPPQCCKNPQKLFSCGCKVSTVLKASLETRKPCALARHRTPGCRGGTCCPSLPVCGMLRAWP